MNTPSTAIAPSSDELHDRLAEDAKLLELLAENERLRKSILLAERSGMEKALAIVDDHSSVVQAAKAIRVLMETIK